MLIILTGQLFSRSVHRSFIHLIYQSFNQRQLGCSKIWLFLKRFAHSGQASFFWPKKPTSIFIGKLISSSTRVRPELSCVGLNTQQWARYVNLHETPFRTYHIWKKKFNHRPRSRNIAAWRITFIYLLRSLYLKFHLGRQYPDSQLEPLNFRGSINAAYKFHSRPSQPQTRLQVLLSTVHKHRLRKTSQKRL